MTKTSESGIPIQDLEHAMAAFHRQLDDWEGVPTQAALAQCMSIVRLGYSLLLSNQDDKPPRNILSRLVRRQRMAGLPKLSARQNFDNIQLLDTVIALLAGQDQSGWQLNLKGTQGPNTTYVAFDEKFNIAQQMLRSMESGKTYELAKEEVADLCGCGETKVAEAYSQVKAIVVEFERLDKLEPAVAQEYYARCRVNPKPRRGKSRQVR